MADTFLDLPIYLREIERNGEWKRDVRRLSSIRELLEIWNLDDPAEDSEMAQVLRHLREALKDAARYRWLRDTAVTPPGSLERFVALNQLDFFQYCYDFDSAIDAAMAQDKARPEA